MPDPLLSPDPAEDVVDLDDPATNEVRLTQVPSPQPVGESDGDPA